MARGSVKHPWEDELKIWELLFIKGEPLYLLPTKTEFTEYRLNKRKKRFKDLSYSEWTLLPGNLRLIHPNYSEYAEGRGKVEASDRRSSTSDAVAAYIEHLRARQNFGDSYRPMRSSKESYGTRQEVLIEAIRRQEPELALLQEAFEQETANRQQHFEKICSLLNRYVHVGTKSAPFSADWDTHT